MIEIAAAMDTLRRMTSITELLDRAGRGDSAAANELVPMIYDRLRAIAHRQLAKVFTRATLATTALVHEAYLAILRAPNRRGRIVDGFLLIQPRRCATSSSTAHGVGRPIKRRRRGGRWI